MFLTALLASGSTPSPSPSATTDPTTATLQDAQQSATNAASWVEQNWSTWLAIGLRVLLILVIAGVLRVVVRRAITKLIDRMTRTVQAVDGTALGGLLVNVERRRQRSQAIGSVLRSVASFLIMGTAALMILGTFQINLAPLLASAGVAGVAIGFGARNLVTDFLSGVFMILEDQYGVGDTIDAGVASGEVIEVGLRVTKLRGDNGEIWYVRNGEVKRIGNLSQGWATAGVDVTVRSNEDLDKVKRTLDEVAEAMTRKSPGTSACGARSRSSAWTASCSTRWSSASRRRPCPASPSPSNANSAGASSAPSTPRTSASSGAPRCPRKRSPSTRPPRCRPRRSSATPPPPSRRRPPPSRPPPRPRPRRAHRSRPRPYVRGGGTRVFRAPPPRT